MRNAVKKYNPSEENAAIIVSINKYGRVLSNWDYLKEIEKLEDRIDQAIEYIEKDMKRILIPFDEFVIWDDTNVENEINKLLDILKGEDKE